MSCAHTKKTACKWGALTASMAWDLGSRVLLQSSLYSEEAATAYSSECWSQCQNFQRLPHMDQFKFCLWFSAAQARNGQGQVRLAVCKYLKLCVTKLVLSAQGTCQVGLHLCLTTTSDGLCRWLEADLRSLHFFLSRLSVIVFGVSQA